MSDTITTPLPCVVHLGFAGSRRLFASAADEARFGPELERRLAERLKELEGDLNLGEHRFLCGISQIAIGADTLFSRVCKANDYLHRVFLPQHVKEYLRATGSGGPDFTPEQRKAALRLLADHHVIQVRTVGHSADRGVRFQETNFEIARLSDVVVCLLNADAETVKATGTAGLLDQAKLQAKPALEIRFWIDKETDQLKVVSAWIHKTAAGLAKLPHTPKVLADFRVAVAAGRRLPTIGQFIEAMRRFGSTNADGWKQSFRFAAFVIVLFHILATVCATTAIIGHRSGTEAGWWLTGLLGFELVLLGSGFLVHHRLQRSEASRVWALNRLVASVARSVDALVDRHFPLEYLFQLPMPDSCRPVFRTMSVLHLRSTRPKGAHWAKAGRTPWENARNRYRDNRVGGQIDYYTRQLDGRRGEQWGVKRWLRTARFAFVVSAFAAILATTAKLTGLPDYWHNCSTPPGAHSHELELLMGILGGLAIVLPVLAVGALSLAGAMDCYARAHTYSEMLPFLKEQVKLLTAAQSSHEFERLAFLTESRLLGEVVNWFYRRSFTEVS